jgi:protein-disulfide isomerase
MNAMREPQQRGAALEAAGEVGAAQGSKREPTDIPQTARRIRGRRLGIAVAALGVAVAVVLIAAACGGSNRGPCAAGDELAPGCGNASARTRVIHEVDDVLAGIPQSGNALGSPGAAVTLQYFGDLECPICRKFTLGALPSIINRWVRQGKLRIEYLSLETATREPEAFEDQQVAALAAGRQDKMWNYLELFYHEQGTEGTGYVNEGYLRDLAQQVPGLKLAKWDKARSDPTFNEEINRDAELAAVDNMTGTPSFLIGHTGGATKRLESSPLGEPRSFDEAVEQQLKA